MFKVHPTRRTHQSMHPCIHASNTSTPRLTRPPNTSTPLRTTARYLISLNHAPASYRANRSAVIAPYAVPACTLSCAGLGRSSRETREADRGAEVVSKMYVCVCGLLCLVFPPTHMHTLAGKRRGAAGAQMSLKALKLLSSLV